MRKYENWVDETTEKDRNAELEPAQGRMELDDFPTSKLANRPENRNQKASIIHRM